MAKHIWSVLCQRSVIDQQSNNISLIDVFESLTININIPSTKKDIAKIKDINLPVNYEIVSLWLRENEKKQEELLTRVDFETPSGIQKVLVEKELILPLDKQRMRDIIRIQGIVVNETGLYKFIVKSKDKDKSAFKTIAELPLEIVINRVSPN